MHFDPPSFLVQAHQVFAPQLAHFEFLPDGEEVEEDWAAYLRYRAGKRYIEITAECHVREGAPSCRIFLGHGTHSYPDSDWNKIDLWRIRPDVNSFRILSIAQLPDLLETMLQTLLLSAQDFLTGDLSSFISVRASYVRDREPYKKFVQQADGKLKEVIDPASLALKERYSKLELDS